VLLVAVAVRVAFLLLSHPGLTGDAADYDRLARQLVSGVGYLAPDGSPTAWRPPGYPVFLAGVYALFGPDPGAARWIQAVVDVGSVGLVFILGRRLFGRRAGLLAGLLAAVNLAPAAAPARILSETLFGFLLLAALGLLVEPRPVRATAAGAVLGLATLTRGILLPFPPAVALWLWIREGRPRSAALLLVGFVVSLAPWTVRNAVELHALVPVSTQVGHTLYSSYHPPDGWRFGLVAHDSVTAAALELPEPEASRALVRATAESMARRPGRLPRLELLKAVFFFAPFDWEILPRYGAFNPTYVLILVLAVGWLLTAPGVRRGDRVLAVWGPVAYFLVMALLFYGSPRFRLPVEPLLALPAGAFLDRRIAEGGVRRALLEVGGLAVALALATLGAGWARAVVGGWLRGGS